jgi:hypothetical protein
MNRERLEHLKTVMARVPPKNFFMGKWVSPSYEHPCNTTCCAGGWAALDPTFQTQGLSFRTRKFEGTYEDIKALEDFHSVITKSQGRIYDFYIRYQCHGGGVAIEKFFDLNPGQRIFLFGSLPSNPTIEGFIIRLNEILEGNVE